MTIDDIQNYFRGMLKSGIKAGNISPEMPENMLFELLSASVACALIRMLPSIPDVHATGHQIGTISSHCVAALHPIKDELRGIMRTEFESKNPNRKEAMI